MIRPTALFARALPCASPHALLFLLALAPFGGGALAAPPEPGQASGGAAEGAAVPNVRVTIRIGGEQDGVPLQSRTYSMIGASGAPAMSMLGGERVPIPVTTFSTAAATAASQPAPATSFTYQNVGFNAQIETSVLDDGRIRLRGTIENSQLVPTDGAQPQIATFEQQFLVLLRSGEPMRVMTAEGVLRTVWFEIEATTIG